MSPPSKAPTAVATAPRATPSKIDRAPPFGVLTDAPEVVLREGPKLRTRTLGKNLISAAASPDGREIVLVGRKGATIGPLGTKGDPLPTRAVELGLAVFSPAGTRIAMVGNGIELFSTKDRRPLATTAGWKFEFLSEDVLVLTHHQRTYNTRTREHLEKCSTDFFDARRAVTTTFRDEACRDVVHIDRQAQRVWVGDRGGHPTTAGEPAYRTVASMDPITGERTTILDEAEEGPMIGLAVHQNGGFLCYFRGTPGEPGDGRYALFCRRPDAGAQAQRIASDVRPSTLQLDPTRERLVVCAGEYRSGMSMRLIDLEARTVERFAAADVGCARLLPGVDAMVAVDDYRRVGAMVDLRTHQIRRAGAGEWDDAWPVPGRRAVIVGLEQDATRDLVLWEL